MRLGLRFLWLCLLTCLALGAWAQTPPAARTWQQLSPLEQRALAPLSTRWTELTDIQRGKWQQVAQQFDQLSSAEQEVLQARMADWVALSPAERHRARLNFNSLQNLSREEKRSKWDEYQSLSEEHKKALSARTLTPSRTAAPSPRPQDGARLVQPRLRGLPAQARQPLADIDPKTLLPRLPTRPGTPTAPPEATGGAQAKDKSAS